MRCASRHWPGLLLGLAGGAAAASDALRLPDLTVTAPDGSWRASPASVSEVDGARAAAGLGLELGDALAGVPGVFAQNRSNFAQGLRIAIRGFGARAAFGTRGIRVVVDGVPLTLADGQTELDSLDLEAVESIRVSRGAAAARFGNASGGVISIRSRRPGEARGAEVSAIAGADGLQRVRVAAQTGDRRFGLGGAFATASLDGHRPQSAYRADIGQAGGRVRIGDGELVVRLSTLDVSAQDPGGLTRDQVRADRRQAAARNLRFDAGELIRQQRLSLDWSGERGDGLGVELGAHAGLRDFANRLPFASAGQVDLRRRYGGGRLQIHGEASALGLEHRLGGGLDLQWQRDLRQRFDNLDGARGDRRLHQDEAADGIGLWLQDAVVLDPAWVLAASLRQDYLRLSVDDRFRSDGDDSGARRFDDTSAALALHWRATPALQGHARLSTAYESPTTTELANPDGGGFNPALSSARSLGAELGLSARWLGADWQLAVFRIDVDDELLPFERDDQPGRRFFRNAGQSRRDGIELSASAEPSPGLQLGAAVTVGDFRFRRYRVDGEDFAGRALPGVPAAHGHLSLQWRAGDWRLAAEAQFAARRWADDANTVDSPGYGVVHAEVGWQRGALALRAGVRNLLDQEYDDNVRINAFGGRHFEPAAGRRAYAGLRWHFGGRR